MNHRRFAISAITFVISFANALVFYSYPFLLGALKISNGIAGIVVGVASCLTMVCRLASGVYMDKVGGRYVMTIITAAYVIFFAILSSPFVQLVMLGRVLIGVSLGILSTVLMYHTIASAESHQQKGQHLALYTFFSMLPTCLAPSLSLEIIHYTGVKPVVWLATMLSLMGLALALFLEYTSPEVGGQRSNTHFSLRALLMTVCRPQLCFTLVSLGFLYTISGVTVSFLPGLLASANQSYASRYLLIYAIAMLLPRLLLKDHMPAGHSFPTCTFLIAALCAFVGCACTYVMLSSPFVLIGAFLSGSALGFIYPAIAAYVVCQSEDHIRGSMTAVTACSADGGVILANLTLGVSAMVFSGKSILLLPVFFTACAVMLLIIAAFFARNISMPAFVVE